MDKKKASEVLKGWALITLRTVSILIYGAIIILFILHWSGRI